jgi:hypothetical protein
MLVGGQRRLAGYPNAGRTLHRPNCLRRRLANYRRVLRRRDEWGGWRLGRTPPAASPAERGKRGAKSAAHASEPVRVRPYGGAAYGSRVYHHGCAPQEALPWRFPLGKLATPSGADRLPLALYAGVSDARTCLNAQTASGSERNARWRCHLHPPTRPTGAQPVAGSNCVFQKRSVRRVGRASCVESPQMAEGTACGCGR